MAHHLSPSAATDAELFAELFRLVPEHGLSVPPEVAAAFRCPATLQGTLTHLGPGFDLEVDFDGAVGGGADGMAAMGIDRLDGAVDRWLAAGVYGNSHAVGG